MIPMISSTNGVFILAQTAQAAGSQTHRTGHNFYIPIIIKEEGAEVTLHTEITALS